MQSSFLITFYRSSCTVVNWKPCKVWWRVGLWILHAFGPRSVWKEPFGLTWIILSLSVLARALFRPCEIYNAKLSTASALKGKSKLGVLLWGVGSNPSRTPLSADYLHTTVKEKKNKPIPNPTPKCGRQTFCSRLMRFKLRQCLAPSLSSPISILCMLVLHMNENTWNTRETSM